MFIQYQIENNYMVTCIKRNDVTNFVDRIENVIEGDPYHLNNKLNSSGREMMMGIVF